MRILVAAKSEKQALFFLRDMQREYILDWFDENYETSMGKSAAINLQKQGVLDADAYLVENEFEDDPEVVEDFLDNLRSRIYDNQQVFIYEGSAA